MLALILQLGLVVAAGPAHEDKTEATTDLARARMASAEADPKRALELAEAAVRSSPKLAEAHLLHGKALGRLDRPVDAIRALDLALELDASLVEAYRARARAHLVNRSLGDALADLTAALKLEPKDAATLAMQARAYALDGQAFFAIESATAALAIDPKLAEAFSARGMAHRLDGAFNLAIEDCTRALELDPKDHNALFVRAKSFELSKQFAKAIDDYRGVLKLTPRDRFALQALAGLLLEDADAELRNPKEAVELLRQANEIEKWRNFDLMWKLAAALDVIGKTDEAKDIRTRANRLWAPPPPKPNAVKPSGIRPGIKPVAPVHL
jgi:tetratricopeptide (TPR) repeat protein